MPTRRNLFDLTGHVSVITGGNGGIGLGMARALADAGAAVALWGRNQAKTADAVASIRQGGGEAHGFACDVDDEEQVEAAFGATLEQFDHVDSLFANAGVGGSGAHSFIDLPAEEWHRVLRTDLDGVFFTLRAAARHMVERGEGGSLVAVSSVAAIHGQPRGEHYAAAKTGLVGVSRALAVELASKAIRSNVVLPGWTRTAMTERAFAWDRFVERVLPRVPMRRWAEPEDLGGIAVYLASDASRFHTGDTFVIDGGYSIF